MFAHVLSVGTDQETGQQLEKPYATNGYRYSSRKTGAEGSSALAERGWDLMVVDSTLIDMPGTEFVRQARSIHGNKPILMLTSGVDERIAGLAAGADAVMDTPFDETELLVRSESLLRRLSPAHQPYPTIGDFEFSFDIPFLRFRGQELDLRPSRYQILLRLARQANEAVAWGYLMGKPDGPTTLASLVTNVSKLNTKLGLANDGQKYITGVREKGYVLRV